MDVRSYNSGAWGRMKRLLLIIWTLALLQSASGQVRIIFDTDMDTDCDDAGALAMLHALADAGDVEILATVVSSKYAWSVPCVAAVNTWHGRPDLPIGCPKGDGAPTNRGSRYARTIAEEFPATLKTNEDAPNAVAVYRQVLSAQPDRSVVVVSVGYLTNLSDLLSSRTDEHSPLDGVAIVERKVRSWICMGGGYPERLRHGNWGNFMPDPKSTVDAVARWPTPIHFSGLGTKVQTGKGLRQTSADNPVRRIYELYLGERLTRSSWDQVALLYAVRPEAPFWRIQTTGYNHIFPNGTNQWRKEPDKNHNLVTFIPEAREVVTAIIEELMTRDRTAGVSPGP
jgi:hypothetical protein